MPSRALAWDYRKHRGALLGVWSGDEMVRVDDEWWGSLVQASQMAWNGVRHRGAFRLSEVVAASCERCREEHLPKCILLLTAQER